MKRPAPFNILSLFTTLCAAFFTAATLAQAPLPYEAVPVETSSIATPTPTKEVFSDPGNQTPFVRTADASPQTLQPTPGTIPQSTGFPPTYSGGAPIITQPVLGTGTPGSIMPHGMYDQGYGRSGWVAGFAFVFLRPFHNNNNAFIARNTAGATRDTNAEFDWDRKISPRVWVEFVGNDDFGARVTYWQFDNDTGDAGLTSTATNNFFTRNLGTSNGSVLSTNVGDNITANSSLNMYTIDAEFTQRLRLQKWQANVGGGFRNAGVHQSYRASGTVGGNAFSSSSSQRFDGIGPTAFAELRRPLWNCGFSLLAIVRGSLLYGDSRLNSSDVVGGTAASFSSTNGQVVPVGEIQLGAEWSTWLNQTTVFYWQVAWEGQYWAGVGNASSRNDDLGLLGFNTSVGLEW
ncbi:hypothetical protein MNBD_PLANCTO02-1973 [hydrothermal vent metagenome]|uniref:Uncharacterized protein n=1 Tax=hydrothermal vent metagenome TaxID=652676 RepID=A0A3B1DJM1_9ZZZZ